MPRNGIPRRLLAGAAAGAAALLAPAAAPAADWFPEHAGTRGRAVDDLFWLATGLTAVAFAAVVAILAWSVVAYRARPGRTALYADGSGRRAKVVTGVFAAAVFVGLDVVLAVRDEHAWREMYGDRASLDASNSLEVQCLAKQFEWLFRYPGKDGRFGTGDDLHSRVLVVPDDRPTVVRLRSIDVVHSFFVPAWRTKQDAVPGMTTSTAIHPEPGRTGTFEIACAELCGMNHYQMRGTVDVRTREAFDAWVAGKEREVAESGSDATEEVVETWALYGLRSRKEAVR